MGPVGFSSGCRQTSIFVQVQLFVTVVIRFYHPYKCGLKNDGVPSGLTSTLGGYQLAFGPGTVRFWCDPVQSLHGTGS